MMSVLSTNHTQLSRYQSIPCSLLLKADSKPVKSIVYENDLYSMSLSQAIDEIHFYYAVNELVAAEIPSVR